MSKGLGKASVQLITLTALGVGNVSVEALQLHDRIDLSGFARVVAGQLDGDSANINGYDDDASLKQQSLIALQPTVQITPTLSITGQFLAHSNSSRDSGTEWLYLSYMPNASWQFRAGKLRMPTYAYSDSIDVGYSYPWITAPLQVYNNYLIPTFTGASASYNYAGRQFALYMEGFYGYFDGDIFQAGSRVDVSADVSDLRGLTASISSNNVTLRLAYNTAHNKTDVPQLTPIRNFLSQSGFNDSADSLDSDGRASFYEASLSYDSLNGFIKTEWTRTETELDLAPSLDGYYLAAGYFIRDWTIHLTYGSSSYSEVKAQQELRPLLADRNNPLFETAAGYYQFFDSVPNGSLDSYTLGVRWDFDLNMAFKAEVSHFNETSPRSGFFGTRFTDGRAPTELDKKLSATLYQLGWEWVF